MAKAGIGVARTESRLRRAVVRLIRRLPAPRDEAAIATLRGARAFVRGTAITTAKPVAEQDAGRQKPEVKTVLPRRYAGQWIRVVAASPGDKPAEILESTDQTEASAVRAGWLLIDAHERLSSSAAAKVFGHETSAWNEYAEQTIAALKSPQGRIEVGVEENWSNRLRYRRTIDFAQKGDRVFDVGFGRGYLAAQLILQRGVASYHGIDIVDTWVEESMRLLTTNGVDTSSVELEAGDLFALTQDQIASTGANLVICCEVLEHVDNAERALKVLADALPPGADLLFSVPLAGRLEQVWGHVSVFDVARLKGMLEGAGLVAHHVEPLANTWSLIVASKDPELSARVRAASGRPPVNTATALVRARHFINVPAQQLTAQGGAVTNAATTNVMCVLSHSGGVTFPVQGLEALRLEFDFVDCTSVIAIEIAAKAGRKTRASWSWSEGGRHAATGQRRVWFRPGEGSPGFVAGPHQNLADVEAVEVRFTVRTGTTAQVGLRAAYLP